MIPLIPNPSPPAGEKGAKRPLAARLTVSGGRHMVFHMKTTLNIDDNVMRRLKEEAARTGKTMAELVEAGLRRVLEDREVNTGASLPALPSWNSGGANGDVADRDALMEVMESD